MNILQLNWAQAPIYDLLQALQDGKLVHQGWSPKCESIPAIPSKEWGALKTTAIQDGAYKPEHNKKLPESLDPKERLEVKAGDILMTCAGPRIRCGVTCLVRETPEKLFISGKMYRFRAVDGFVDGRYLESFLRAPATKELIDVMKTGISESGMNITHEKFSQLNVPVPPFNEQRRIADKLDTTLARVDALNGRLARITPLLQRFRQSVLAAATSGRLTEDWRSASDAKWKLSRVDDVAKVFLGRQRSPANHDGPYMRPYVRAANVTWSGWDLSDVKEMNFDNADFERYQLKQNDILLNEGSGSADEVGKPAIWNEEIENCCFQNTLICVRPEKAEPKFLFYALLYAAISKKFVDNTRGVNIHHIGKQNMAAFPILVPGISEQQEMVRRVETLFAFADRLEARLQSAQTAAERLTPALLAKAFRGELVPHDPNDEPATELLRRLREARAAEAPAKPKRGRK